MITGDGDVELLLDIGSDEYPVNYEIVEHHIQVTRRASMPVNLLVTVFQERYPFMFSEDRSLRSWWMEWPGTVLKYVTPQ